jgi:hypothetical protein
MMAMDGSVPSGAQPVLKVRLPVFALVAAASGLLTLGIMARSGFADQGLRLGSEFAWRFASFVFFVAASIGPLCRIVPFGFCKQVKGLRRQAIWSFCACYGVFLAAMLLPNTLGGVIHDDETLGMSLFALFGGAAAIVMAYSVAKTSMRLEEKVRRALLSVAAAFFWLTYALTGLAHISGPHRPDAYYGVSLCLMILALFLRFADRLLAKFRGTPVPSLQS